MCMRCCERLFVDGARRWRKVCEKARWSGELRQIRRDGSEICVDSRWSLAHDGPDALRVQINSDITARKMADETLRECEERYRRFVEEDFTGNLIMQPDGRIMTCNPAFARIFGFDSVEEARATNFMSLLHTERKARNCLLSLGKARRRHARDRIAPARWRTGLCGGAVPWELRPNRAS